MAFQEIASTTKWRVSFLDEGTEPRTVTSIPYDIHFVQRRGFKLDRESAPSLWPLPWSALIREKSASDDYDAWLLDVESIEIDDNQGEPDFTQPESEQSAPTSA